MSSDPRYSTPNQMVPVADNPLMMKPEDGEKFFRRVTGSKPKSNEFHPKRKFAFLDVAKRTNLNWAKACEIIGISTHTFYNHVKVDPAFAKAIEELKEQAISDLESTSIAVGKTTRGFLDRCMQLRRLRPEEYDRAKKLVVEGIRATPEEMLRRKSLAVGAVDAEIIKTGMTPAQRKALHQGRLETTGE